MTMASRAIKANGVKKVPLASRSDNTNAAGASKKGWDMSSAVSSMVENAPVNIMCADLDLRIQYINPSSMRTLRRIEQHLPIKADQMMGANIDIFHKQPEHQRRLLADPRNLP